MGGEEWVKKTEDKEVEALNGKRLFNIYLLFSQDVM